ncbi:MAG: alpha/beta hydrolase [Sandaracinaceae bacterium]
MRWTALLLGLLCVSGCDATPNPDDDAAVRGDGGISDAGLADSSVADSSVADSSVADAGGADSGPADAGVDAEAPDAGPGLVTGLRARLEAAATTLERDAIVHEAAWSGRWPASDASGWLFVTRWPDAPEAVSLVGDPFGWDEGLAATRLGDHYIVFVEGALTSAAGAKYKWRAGSSFRSPGEATAYGSDDFGEFGYVAPPADARWRERFPAHASAYLEDRRTFRALLPAGFVRGDRARPVLFMHDGQNLFDPAPFGGWRVHAALDDASDTDTVVLAVDNAPDRMSAYTHVADDVGSGVVGGRADAYLDLVEREALPFFRERYGVTASGPSLAVAGSSLGGLVSLYAALTRPDLARCVIAMSPTLGWGAYAAGPAPDALLSRWTARGATAVYLDSGGEGACSDPDGDGVQEDAAPRDNLCVTNQLRDRLDMLGYAFDTDLFHWHEPGAEHNEAAWAARVPRALAACRTAGWEPG